MNRCRPSLSRPRLLSLFFRSCLTERARERDFPSIISVNRRMEKFCYTKEEKKGLENPTNLVLHHHLVCLDGPGLEKCSFPFPSSRPEVVGKKINGNISLSLSSLRFFFSYHQWLDDDGGLCRPGCSQDWSISHCCVIYFFSFLLLLFPGLQKCWHLRLSRCWQQVLPIRLCVNGFSLFSADECRRTRQGRVEQQLIESTNHGAEKSSLFFWFDIFPAVLLFCFFIDFFIPDSLNGGRGLFSFFNFDLSSVLLLLLCIRLILSPIGIPIACESSDSSKRREMRKMLMERQVAAWVNLKDAQVFSTLCRLWHTENKIPAKTKE